MRLKILHILINGFSTGCIPIQVNMKNVIKIQIKFYLYDKI
jgi:hypothetical protein